MFKNILKQTGIIILTALLCSIVFAIYSIIYAKVPGEYLLINIISLTLFMFPSIVIMLLLVSIFINIFLIKFDKKPKIKIKK